MFRKVLIANRGEIALRIIRACKELGIKTVAVYSKADETSLHVRFADEAVCIGPPPSKESYLKIPHIIAAAEVTNADAIHPGYGFLAENETFAEICRDHGITFIGPTPEQIAAMGNKSVAKETMRAAGVPVIPGSEGVVSSYKEAAALAREIGYPIMLKAVAGGGGKGMRYVESEAELEQAFITARNEADAAFGNPDVYLEKFLEEPRHIEFQVFGDQHGNVIHLNERECSIQRRHQKLIEEAPSPIMTPELRSKMGEAAKRGAAAVGYVGAGTIEFLVDKYRNFYFMEMNTRIQVEHPVTEMITGIDMVQEQIRIAAGEKLRWTQDAIGFCGHAIECRINAECPDTMLPSPGRITAFHIPGGSGIRVDTAAYHDYHVTPHYDPLIAKLISYAPDRLQAIRRMERALEMTVVEGIKTNIQLHERILKDEDFRAGRIHTRFLDRYFQKQN